MPIRVSVRFHRKGAYFLAGEQVSCVITFANESGEPGAVENLAWSSVQLHCQEVINDHKVRIPPSKLLNAANTNKTSFAPTKSSDIFVFVEGFELSYVLFSFFQTIQDDLYSLRSRKYCIVICD